MIEGKGGRDKTITTTTRTLIINIILLIFALIEEALSHSNANYTKKYIRTTCHYSYLS